MSLRSFSDEDMEVLAEVVRRVREQRKTKHGSWFDIAEQQASDTYICLTPSSGIPGLQEPWPGTGTGTGADTEEEHDRPGFALCDVYRVLPSEHGDELRKASANLQVRVYNLDHASVLPNRFVLPTKDKFGKWVIPSAGSSGAGAYICLTPAGGIPGLREPWPGTGTGTGTEEEYDMPGSALCEVYKIELGVHGVDEMRKVVPTELLRVYNLNHAAVSELQFITPVLEGKSGKWVVPSMGIQFQDCP